MIQATTRWLLLAALSTTAQPAAAVTNLLTNPGFEDTDADMVVGDDWGAFGAAGFNDFFGPNGHLSLFGDTVGNNGGVFQLGIPAVPGERYQFDLLDTRIEANWDAELRVGVEFYTPDDTTKVGETIVIVDTAERLALPNVDGGGAVNGSVFSVQAVAPAGAAIARPIVLFDGVNPLYFEESQANLFVFEAFFAATPVGGELLKNPSFDEDFGGDGSPGDLWGAFGNAGINDLFGGNFHASFFADTVGNSGGVFQESIVADPTATYRFTLEDTRIEAAFDADLRFGLEYYDTDNATKLGETIVPVDTSVTGDNLTFSMTGTPVAGAAFVRPVVLFDDVNPAYFEQPQAGAFVFDVSLVEVIALDGDYNENGVIDAADYTVWRDAQASGATSLPNEAASPGAVDLADYTVWANAYSASSAVAVPEPSTIALFGLASLGALWRRR